MPKLFGIKITSLLPVWEEAKKDNRRQRDTLGKLWFIVFFLFFKKEWSLHRITADKTPKLIPMWHICIKKLTNFEFFFTIGNFRNSGTLLIYKLCKNKTKKNTERDVNEKEITFEFHVTLYFCTQYTNWSFLLASLILVVYFD